MWPPDDEFLDLWARLADDASASEVFAAAVLQPLQAVLGRKFPNADLHDVATAAGVAITAFVRNPGVYDPTRCSIPGFLLMVAKRDLLNLLDKEKRHHRGRKPWAVVELTAPARNELEEADSLDDFPQLRAVAEAMSDADRRFLALMATERKTNVFAAELGITHLPAADQAVEVKRHKDRIMALLRRAWRRK